MSPCEGDPQGVNLTTLFRVSRKTCCRACAEPAEETGEQASALRFGRFDWDGNGLPSGTAPASLAAASSATDEESARLPESATREEWATRLEWA